MSLATNLQNLAQRIGNEQKALRTLLNGNAADNSALLTTAKSNLVAAINELHTAVQNAAESGGAAINDDAPSTATTYSGTKIEALVSGAVAAFAAGAPEALDTIDELAAALQDNPAQITDILTALANRVRFDAAQTLTAPQQAQARTNIGAASAADVGDTATNFVTTFEAALV